MFLSFRLRILMLRSTRTLWRRKSRNFWISNKRKMKMMWLIKQIKLIWNKCFKKIKLKIRSKLFTTRSKRKRPWKYSCFIRKKWRIDLSKMSWKRLKFRRKIHKYLRLRLFKRNKLKMRMNHLGKVLIKLKTLNNFYAMNYAITFKIKHKWLQFMWQKL